MERAHHRTMGGRGRDRVRDPQTGIVLGRTQLGVLDVLREFGVYPGGWVWLNHSTTVRVLNSLVRAKLATRDDRGVFRPARTFNARVRAS